MHSGNVGRLTRLNLAMIKHPEELESMSLSIVSWILNPNLWFILGTVILASGAVLGWMDVALILGVPALLQALIIAFFPAAMQSWEAVTITYIATTSVTFALFLRFKTRISGGEYDVNDD